MANRDVIDHNDLNYLINFGINSPLDAPPDFTAVMESSPVSDETNKTASTSFSTTQPRTINDCQGLSLLQDHSSRYPPSHTYDQQSLLVDPIQYQGGRFIALQPTQDSSSNSLSCYGGNGNVLPVSQSLNGNSTFNKSQYTWSEVHRNAAASSSIIQSQSVNGFHNRQILQNHHVSHQTSCNNDLHSRPKPSVFYGHRSPQQRSYMNEQQSFLNPPVFQGHPSSYQTSSTNKLCNPPVVQGHQSYYQTSSTKDLQSLPAPRSMTAMDYCNQRAQPLEHRYYTSHETHNLPSCSRINTTIGNDNYQSAWQEQHSSSSLMPQSRSDLPLVSTIRIDLMPQPLNADQPHVSTKGTDLMPQILSNQPLVSANRINFMSQNSPDKPLASTKRKAIPAFACETCGSVFVHKCSLMEHMKRHSDFLGYSCATCGTAFNDRSTLSKHIRTHTGERPYACDKCNARFTQSGNLKRHERKFH